MKTKLPETLTFSELIKKADNEPVIPVIEGLINLEEFILLSATAKSGKTLLAFDMSVCIAKGHKFLGIFQCRKHKVLFIQSEVSNSMLASRIRKRIEDTKDPELNEGIVFCNSPIKLDTHEGHTQLQELIKQHNVQVVVIDPFYKHHNKKEDSASDMAPLLGKISELKKIHKIAIFMTHHQGKRNEGSNGQQAGHKHRGSSAFGDVPDGSISMERGSYDGINKLKFEMRNIESPKELEIQRLENLSWIATGNQVIEDKTCSPHDVLDLVISKPGLNYSELKKLIMDKFIIKERQSENKISDAVRLGFIEKVSEGRNTKYHPIIIPHTRPPLEDCVSADTTQQGEFQ